MSDAGAGRRGPRAAAISLGLATVVSLALVLTPMAIIMPFKPQTPEGVRLSYHLRAWSPHLTAVLLGLGLLAAVVVWRRARSRWRWSAALPIALLAGAAWLARQNHFEWMFHPLPDPAFTSADGPHGAGADDLVLGVAAGGEAVAYPVRALAYHHVVNATVGGRPLVATY